MSVGHDELFENLVNDFAKVEADENKNIDEISRKEIQQTEVIRDLVRKDYPEELKKVASELNVSEEDVIAGLATEYSKQGSKLGFLEKLRYSAQLKDWIKKNLNAEVLAWVPEKAKGSKEFEKKYKFYWKDGKIEMSEGKDPADAFSKLETVGDFLELGGGRFAVNMLDHYEESESKNPSGKDDEKTRTKKPRESKKIELTEGVIDDIVATIVDYLKRTGKELGEPENEVSFEEVANFVAENDEKIIDEVEKKLKEKGIKITG